jgi:hypothetical protein
MPDDSESGCSFALHHSPQLPNLLHSHLLQQQQFSPRPPASTSTSPLQPALTQILLNGRLPTHPTLKQPSNPKPASSQQRIPQLHNSSKHRHSNHTPSSRHPKLLNTSPRPRKPPAPPPPTRPPRPNQLQRKLHPALAPPMVRPRPACRKVLDPVQPAQRRYRTAPARAARPSRVYTTHETCRRYATRVHHDMGALGARV